ncbi:MAG: hypothetical protein OEV94_10790 [Deltaproteobacteria bacterium]|nr:hypothetical protein [Deltaproteobacteria bacterium]
MWSWWVVAGCLLVPAGCGYKTPPHPDLRRIPPLTGVRIQQREDYALISWIRPSADLRGQWGEVMGYWLRIDVYPVDCETCSPNTEQAFLPEGSDQVQAEFDRLFTLYRMRPTPGKWEFQISVRYSSGISDPSAKLPLGRLNQIPAHSVSWAWESPSNGSSRESTGRRNLLLSWQPRREQVLRSYHPAETRETQVRYFRANLYRRIEGNPWPLAPLNPKPLDIYHWTDAIPTPDPTKPSPRVEYALRLVDQFGGEGPLSPVVQVQPAEAARQ